MDAIDEGTAAGATSATGTENYAAVIGTGAALTTVATGATATPSATGTTRKTGATGTTAIKVTTNAKGGANTNSTNAEYKDKNQETQANIVLPSPMANLSKELQKTLLGNQQRLSAQINAFLPQDSSDITQLNDADNKPVVGIIKTPKSSTIKLLHYFGVGTNPIGGSYPITGKILPLAGNGSSENPPYAMVLPSEVLHKTSIRVPTQEVFYRKIINSQVFPLFKNTNIYNKEIILKAIIISSFLV